MTVNAFIHSFRLSILIATLNVFFYPPAQHDQTAAVSSSSSALLSAEYFLFCEMLLQRPINMRELGLSNVLSQEDTAYMREMASQRFDRVMQVLKAMPRPMLLIFRNINTVRSINISLGAPVDRYFVMAKRY